MIWLVRALGFFTCIACGFLALLLAWAGMAAKSEPNAVLAIVPSARALYASIENQRLGGPTPPGLVSQRARQLLRLAPLSDAPFAMFGLDAAAAGRASDADRAFALALSRNPRNAPARIWLAQRAIDAGELDKAVNLIDGLITVDPTRGSSYVDALVQIGALPGGAETIARHLGTDAKKPGWGAQVVRRLNQSLADLDALAKLNQFTPQVQAQFVERVRTERGPEAAFQAWLSLLPPGEVEDFHWPYDQAFEGKPAPPPFNWTPRTDQVEYMSGGGLAVTYLGRGRVRLIDQQMLLAPGDYRLVSVLTGDASPNGGGLSWSVTCIESNQDLAAVRMKDLFGKSVTDTGDFSVPDGRCGSQRLALNGVPGEFPTRARAEVQSVAIVRRQAVAQ